jgi:hypothetical protein
MLWASRLGLGYFCYALIMFEGGDNEDFKLNILAVRMGACLKMFAKEE